MNSVLYNLEVQHNGEWLYKSTVYLQAYDTVEQVKEKYKKLIAYSRMVNENELEVIMSEYQYLNN